MPCPYPQDVLENQSIIWLASWSRPTLEASRFAAQVSDRVIGVWVCEPNDDFEALRQRWRRLFGDAPQFELRLLEKSLRLLDRSLCPFRCGGGCPLPGESIHDRDADGNSPAALDHLLLNHRGLNMLEALNERRSRVFTVVRYFPPA